MDNNTANLRNAFLDALSNRIPNVPVNTVYHLINDLMYEVESWAPQSTEDKGEAAQGDAQYPLYDSDTNTTWFSGEVSRNELTGEVTIHGDMYVRRSANTDVAAIASAALFVQAMEPEERMDRKIHTIKVVRANFGTGLKVTKDIVDTVNNTLGYSR